MRRSHTFCALLLGVATALGGSPSVQAQGTWQDEANRRIDAIRKGTLRVQVLDSEGHPVPGAQVFVKQTRHAFRFGTAVVLHRLLEPGADNEQYRSVLKRCFTMAEPEDELKWGPREGEFDPVRFAPRFKLEDFAPEKTMAGLRWLRANDFYVRGHTLIWPSWRRSTAFLERCCREDPAALRAIIRTHISEEAAALKPFIDEWDVVNEPALHSDILELLGPAVMAEWFKAAREALPTTPLYMNETNLIAGSTSFETSRTITDQHLRTLMANDAPIDGLGIQAHVRWDHRLSMPEVVAYLDHVRDLGLAVSITELDIRGCSETELAEHTRDFLIATFSHPSVKSINMWGFWAGDIQRPEYAMFRKDWSPRSNGTAYMDLVFRQWWTSEEAVSDKEGLVKTRAFFGDYEVSAKLGERQAKKTVRLPEGTETRSVVLAF